MKKRFPLSPNPVGWYAVALSEQLAVGGVLPLSYLGQDLVAFRGDDGVARVLDAYCPHLGAHLGHGGVVEGATIRCPFHGWSFSGEGSCTKVPYAAKIPPGARVASWLVCERNGFVMIWYHPTKAPPSWDIPAIAEYQNEAWTPFTRRRWKIRTNIHEMGENGHDGAHFRYVHGLRNLPAPEPRFEGPTYTSHASTVMDTPFGGVIEGTLDIHSLGFGVGYVRFTGVIETLLVSTVTPLDDDHVEAMFSFTVRKLPDEGATAMVGATFIDEVAHQLEQDIPIWEHKTFLERPLLCESEGPIGAFRRWARQFYPELAPRPARTERALPVLVEE